MMQKDVKLWGLPIIRVKKTELCEKRYFLGVQYKVKGYAWRYDSFAEAFVANVSNVHNRRIKVIVNNSGEAVTYARTHALWYNPDELIFGNRPQHADIFRMFAPQIPVFYCGNAVELKEPQCIDGNHVEPFLSSSRLLAMNNQGKPFLQSWAEYMHIDLSSLTCSHAVIPPEVESSILTKAQALRLNLDNFVFLSPAARSCEVLPPAFWDGIETSLRAKGYDVFYNSQLRIVEHIVTLGAQRSLNPIPESGRQNLAGTGGGREKNKIVQIEPQRLRFGENTALNLRGNNSVGACERRQIDMHILRPRLQEGLSLVIHREET